MQDQDISQLELFCTQLYQSPDPVIRSEAEKALIVFSNSSDCLQKCQFLLERGTTSYSQLLASSTITKLITKSSATVTLQQRVEIRNYVLNYLATRSKLAPFVVQSLSQLLVKVTKYGWFDSQNEVWVFRSITKEITLFLQGAMEHCIIGVKLLNELVNNMNQSEGNLSLAKNRKISSSFRDDSLLDTFQSAVNMIKRMSSEKIDFQNQQQISLLGGLLQLVRSCLLYDFIGTSFDESTDDMGTVHIPTTWKQYFLDFSMLNLFMDLYLAVPTSISHLALSCFVQLASIRRSLFDATERSKYLQELMNGVRKILELPQALEDTNNYHEFCRLLSRIKANYQLAEIIKINNYKENMEMIAKFTVSSLQVLNFAPNSLYYLLNTWQKMVSSCPFIRATDIHHIELFTPQITEAYITSRLESVKDIVQNGIDDPLDDKSTLHQQLDQISTIGRCDYAKSCALLISIFDVKAQEYQKMFGSAGQPATASQSEVAVLEGQLTWLVYIIGYSVGGRVSFSSTDEDDRLDGELCTRVLKLMNLTDTKLPQVGAEKLELALITFFDQFKKNYIGDQINKTSKVYQVISDNLGISDETTMLDLFTRKIITNLKYWSNSEKIIDSTLSLLNDLSVGYSSVRKLVKLDAIQFLLNNHTAEHFPFLGVDAGSVTKCRSLLYTALGRLLLADIGDEQERFRMFALPLTAALENLYARLNPQNAITYPIEETKRLLMGICRDLKGLAFVLNTRHSFQLFFDWLHPKYTTLMQQALDLFYMEPEMACCVLKFLNELTQNRSQRLQFDIMRDYGVLLFREISKALVNYGTRILTLTAIPADRLYIVKLKGVSTCFNMLKAALSGGYVNFGVMKLYGDTALENALKIFIKMLETIQQRDLLDYPKLGKSYYSLTEIVVEHHIDMVCNMDPQVFLYIISSVSEGLTALDLAISTGCCTALDHIVTYLFVNWQKFTKDELSNSALSNSAHPTLKILEHRPEMLQKMLTTVISIVMFEDCRNMWSMSRPLLGLILINEKYFEVLEERITRMLPGDKQQQMAIYFRELMEEVERSLTTKNRDRFTQNLSTFRANVKGMMGVLSSTMPILQMMGFDL